MNAGVERAAALTAVVPHAGTAHHLRTALDGPVVLAFGADMPLAHVGRVVDAYDVLATWLVPDAHLVVAGPLDTTTAVLVQERLRRANLPGAWLAGPVDDEVLVAFLGHASVALLRGDGPGAADDALVALTFGLPCVGGPPDVVGRAGLPVADTDPAVVRAGALAALLRRPASARLLANRARRAAAERLARPA